AACGFAWLPAGRLAAIALSCLFLAFAITWMGDPKLQREDWREAADHVSRCGPGTAVVTGADGVDPLRVYLPSAHSAAGPVGVRCVIYAAAWRVGRARPAAPAPPPLPLVERANLPSITLVRYRADRRVVDEAGSLAARLGSQFVLVLPVAQ